MQPGIELLRARLDVTIEDLAGGTATDADALAEAAGFGSAGLWSWLLRLALFAVAGLWAWLLVRRLGGRVPLPADPAP